MVNHTITRFPFHAVSLPLVNAEPLPLPHKQLAPGQASTDKQDHIGSGRRRHVIHYENGPHLSVYLLNRNHAKATRIDNTTRGGRGSIPQTILHERQRMPYSFSLAEQYLLYLMQANGV